MNYPTSLKAVLIVSSICTALGTIGCGSGVTVKLASSTTVTVTTAKGIIKGGQQPAAGVTLQLYQAGTTGYGSAATPLGPTAKSDTVGNFNLPSYNCTTGSQVYLVGTGGQPIPATQTSPAITNNNLALMVGLGTCGGADLSNFINVNELTTVATVWALSPFMTGPANIGTSPANTAGLAAAFAAINEIVTTSAGTLPGPALPAEAILPIAEINTLGGILEQCINSAGGLAGDSTNCGNLFQLAPNAAGTVYPTDTITAAMNIAQSPGRNVAALNALRSSSPLFLPALDVNSPPNDWAIAITYVGGGLNAPSSIAADAAGSVWITNKGNSSVTKLDNTGAALSGTSGFSSGSIDIPSAIAIDTSGNAWVANSGNSTVTKLNSTGTSGTVFTGNGLNNPGSIAIDGLGNIWIGNIGSGTVSTFTSSGGALAGSPFSGGGTNAPVSIAIAPN
jgi:hypothetical protein